MGFAYKPIRFDDLTAVHPISPIAGLRVSLEAIAPALLAALPQGLILLDGCPTAGFAPLLERLARLSPGLRTVDVSSLYLSPETLRELFAPYLPLDRGLDPELIFGRLFDQDYPAVLDTEKVRAFLEDLP